MGGVGHRAPTGVPLETGAMPDPAQPPTSTDVLVVGAGPAGSAAAAWAARGGRDVVLADAATFPRDKPCGDGLTPRAIAELDRLGLGDWVRAHGINRGLRATGFGVVLTLPWPGGSLPDHGGAVPRLELDARIREVALKDGAVAFEGARAVDVERDGERVTGVVFANGHTVRCRRLIVADGARSTLGRGAGPRVAPRHGLRGRRPRLHPLRPQRRRVDLLPPGAARRGRRGARRVRVGVPAVRRRGQHRRRHPRHRRPPGPDPAAQPHAALRRRAPRRTGSSTAPCASPRRRCCRWAGRCRTSPGTTGR